MDCADLDDSRDGDFGVSASLFTMLLPPPGKGARTLEEAIILYYKDLAILEMHTT